MEPAAPGPLVEPVPAVRRVHPGQFLVPQHRLHRGMVEFFEHPRSGALDLEPGAPEGRAQVHGGIGIHRETERVIDGAGQLGQPRRPLSGRRSWAQQLGQQVQMNIHPPGQPDKAHLDRRQSGRRLGGHQQRQCPVAGDPPALIGKGEPQRPRWGRDPVGRSAGCSPRRTGRAGPAGSSRSSGTGSPSARARTAAARTGAPNRPSRDSRILSVRAMSWHRSIRIAGGDQQAG